MKLVAIDDYFLAVEPVTAKTVVDETCVVIFLHEALGSIGQWKDFPQLVCNQLQLNGLIYERRGHGNSSPMNKKRGVNYLHEYALDELPKLIDAVLAPDKEVMLVGHSDGASIALLYAANYPKKVRGVVSMAAHVIVEDETLQGIEPAVKAFEEGKLDGLRKYHGDKTDDLFYAWADTWRLPEFRSWNICDDIKGLICSLLILQGVKDQYGTQKQVDLIASSCNSMALDKPALLSRCGHHPHLEAKEEVIDSIKRFHIASELYFQ